MTPDSYLSAYASFRRSALSWCVIAVATASSSARAQDCGWSTLPGPVSGRINAMTVYDDGTGSALFVAGNFTAFPGVTVNRIAKWNGQEWSPLEGPGAIGVNGDIYAMTIYDDGNGPALYVGGAFTAAGGIAVDRIARWDGFNWSTIEPAGGPSFSGGLGGLAPRVRAMATRQSGPDQGLYITGGFRFINGTRFNSVARWDGQSWHTLFGPSEAGIDSFGNAIVNFDDGSGQAIYVGGQYNRAGDVLVRNVAKWDGQNWSALQGTTDVGTSERVLSLASGDAGNGPELFVGGWFDNAGGVPVNRVASWSSAGWAPLSGPAGTGVSGVGITITQALRVLDAGNGPRLYAGGNFSTAGGTTVSRVAQWDGIAWDRLQGEFGFGIAGGNGDVFDFEMFDDGTGPAIYVAGDFFTAGGLSASKIARFRPCPPPCPADLTGSSMPGDPTFGVPDGIVTVDDFFYYLSIFAAGEPAADLSGSTDPSSPAFGIPDGLVTVDDFFFYLTLFAQGC